MGSFPWGLGSLMSSWSIWGHSGVFRVGLGEFLWSFPWGLGSLGSLMSSRGIWGHFGVFGVGLGDFGVLSGGFGVSDVILEHLGSFWGV